MFNFEHITIRHSRIMDGSGFFGYGVTTPGYKV
jgi:hypothetical protein